MTDLKWIRTADSFPEEGKIVLVRSHMWPGVVHSGSFDSSYFHYVSLGSVNNELSGEYCKKYLWDYWAEIPEFEGHAVSWIMCDDNEPRDGDNIWVWYDNSPTKAFVKLGHFIESVDYGEGRELTPVDFWTPRILGEPTPTNSPYGNP